MNDEARRAVEAILMVAEDPVDPHLLAQLIEVSPAELSEAIAELGAVYEAEGRGFVIAQVAGGYRFQSHPELAPYVERFVLEGQTARLSSAALETLAIIAYKQPISRAQGAAIRGVNVDGVVRTLEGRGYIGEVGHDPGPGNPTLFGTTDVFLEKLGLNSIEDLPPLAGFVPDASVVEQLEQGLRVAVEALDDEQAADVDEPEPGDAPAALDDTVDEPGDGGTSTAPDGTADDPRDGGASTAPDGTVDEPGDGGPTAT